MYNWCMVNALKPIVWMVHPRNIHDIEKGMPLLSRLPFFLKSTLLLFISPYKVSSFSEDGRIRGYVVAVPLLPSHFRKYKRFSEFRLSQAFKLSKKLGAEKVSVGGMISSLTEKMNIVHKFGIQIFDGTNLLAQITADKVSQLLDDGKNDIKSVGIIGATTKTGAQLSKYLATRNIQELHLFAKTYENVQALAAECRNLGPVKIIAHIDFDDINKCDVCILTAFISDAGKTIVNDFKKDSFFFSIIEPVSPFVTEIAEKRPDMILVRGITIKTPSLSYSGLDFIISSGNAFSCLTEALVDDADKSSGKFYEVEELLKRHNFQIL